MTRIRLIAKTLLSLSVVLFFSGCTVIRQPLNMDMPKLYFEQGKCVGISDILEYGQCAAKQIEALKTDRTILLEITKRCVK